MKKSYKCITDFTWSKYNLKGCICTLSIDKRSYLCHVKHADEENKIYKLPVHLVERNPHIFQLIDESKSEDTTLDEKGFVFIGGNGKYYWCALYCDEPWIMYWHEYQQSWVTLQRVNQTQIWSCETTRIPDEEAEKFHELHRKFVDSHKYYGENNA